MSDVVELVQALIAKAESSPFPHEADAFMAKAQQLIDTHAIDRARLHGVDPSTVGHETIEMNGSYTTERASIWGAVARANRCEILTLTPARSHKATAMTLVGRGTDRELVRLLATSLEVQALRRMGDLDTDRTWASPVVQRRSFLRGFAIEIDQRLHRERRLRHDLRDDEATRAALVRAADAVDRYISEQFDVSTGRRQRAQFDGMAFSHGRRAGAAADVGNDRLAADRRRLGPGAD